MLVLPTKPLQKLTGTDGQADKRTGRQAGRQTNLCVGRLRLQKTSRVQHIYYYNILCYVSDHVRGGEGGTEGGVAYVTSTIIPVQL